MDAQLAQEALVGSGWVLFAGALAATWLVLRREGRSFAAVGLALDGRAVRELAWALVIGIAVAGVALAALALAGGVVWRAEPGTVDAFAGGGLGLLVSLTLPAAGEEIAMRGYLLQALARRWGALPALGVTSVAFGLLHLGNPSVGWQGVVGITAAGVFLGALVLRHASLWWGIGAHLGWNWALAWPADLRVSGLDLANAPYVVGESVGPAWLGGGAFGPEGSLLVAAVLMLVAWLVWVLPGVAADDMNGGTRS